MGDLAIRVENLGKLYRIGGLQARYRTIRESLTDAIQAPCRRAAKLLRGQAYGATEMDETIWALKDVSFQVKRGELVGIIGRNGAGKTTLLKILSRITEPTEGCAEIYGRVGSLLEVGTGFHPELTGQENIFLNGAILGMKRAEIERKFDEIVAFAEVERFIDTPVKHYSSGMYVRLAFAVAAHLEPEILLVDEVLSVGDVRFQRKCMGKMEEVGKGGRTVLFVSHNMPAVARLCERVLLLDEGKLIQDGPTSRVISAYLRAGLGTTAEIRWEDSRRAPGDDVVRLRAVRVRTEDGTVTESFDIRRPIGVEMEYWILEPRKGLSPNIHVFNDEGLRLFVSGDQHDPAWRDRVRPPGLYKSTCWIPGNFMAEGTFVVDAAISTVSSTNPVTIHAWERDAVAFQVVDAIEGDSVRGNYGGTVPGVVRPLLKWTTELDPCEVLPSIS